MSSLLAYSHIYITYYMPTGRQLVVLSIHSLHSTCRLLLADEITLLPRQLAESSPSEENRSADSDLVQQLPRKAGATTVSLWQQERAGPTGSSLMIDLVFVHVVNLGQRLHYILACIEERAHTQWNLFSASYTDTADILACPSRNTNPILSKQHQPGLRSSKSNSTSSSTSSSKKVETTPRLKTVAGKGRKKISLGAKATLTSHPMRQLLTSPRPMPKTMYIALATSDGGPKGKPGRPGVAKKTKFRRPGSTGKLPHRASIKKVGTIDVKPGHKSSSRQPKLQSPFASAATTDRGRDRDRSVSSSSRKRAFGTGASVG